METLDKIKELNGIMTNPSLTLEEKHTYIDELTSEEMRDIFKEMMSAWASKGQLP